MGHGNLLRECLEVKCNRVWCSEPRASVPWLLGRRGILQPSVAALSDSLSSVYFETLCCKDDCAEVAVVSEGDSQHFAAAFC